MSIQPDDWFSRFFGSGIWPFTRRGGSNNESYFGDLFRGFEDMRREFEEQFENIETKAPKDLIREYETPGGGK